MQGAERSVLHRALAAGCVLLAVMLSACSTRPLNPRIDQLPADGGYRYIAASTSGTASGEDLVILAFSGGGTRAAAFSYGVLEALRSVAIQTPERPPARLLDSVSVITGVSGGSFTALAYGLYGEKLFDEYEQRFLKRDVEGTLLARLFDPSYWGALLSTGWGRSELAADYYDEILFDGATFADLAKRRGPRIVANATDLSSGARFYFSQTVFDIICSDLNAIRLARAAAASSAVPVVLSPVTFDNYGGSCGWRAPQWLSVLDTVSPPERHAAISALGIQEMRAFGDGKARPYLHLVDGGIADNLALRGVLAVLEEFQMLRRLGMPTQFDRTRRIVVFVVNSQSKPTHGWDRREDAPGPLEVLLQAIGVPIDYYSHSAVEQLQALGAQWHMLRGMRDAALPADIDKPAFLAARRAPDAQLFVVNVSFDELTDPAEVQRLNQLPTSLVLAPAAVDELRRAAHRIVYTSPATKAYLQSLRAQGLRVTVPEVSGAALGDAH